jgi:hypothetical protein
VRVHRYICGVEVVSNRLHGLACRRGTSRHRQHAHSPTMCSFAPSVLWSSSHPGFNEMTKERPDGATLDLWSRGRYLCGTSPALTRWPRRMFPVLQRSQGRQLSRREQEASQVHRTIKLIPSPPNSAPSHSQAHQTLVGPLCVRVNCH